jgi:threonine/homoserine/homoserine lactone efflux protein
MFGTQHLTLFIVSGILLNLTPCQDTLYIVGRSVSQGAGPESYLFSGSFRRVPSAISRGLRQHGPSGTILERATGALFVGLGLRLAVSK